MSAPSGWVDPNPHNTDDPAVNRKLAVAGVLLTSVIIAALVIVVLAKGGDGQDDRPILTLTAINAATANAFMDSQVVAPTQISDAAASQIAAFSAQLPVSAGRGVRVIPGTTAGLYGVAEQGFSCDVPGIANQLVGPQEKVSAWAGALGLTADQVPSYLNSLTPVVLTADTWVTAYSYAGGQVEGLQTVLQTGTAVLIDTAGVPRVHCASGDPLSPSANIGIATMNPDGKGWPGFQARNVVAVDYKKPDSAPSSMAEFVLLDVATGQQVKRKPGGVIDLARSGTSPVALPDPAAMNVPPNQTRK